MGRKKTSDFTKAVGLSLRLLAGRRRRGRENVRQLLEARPPQNHVVVKHSAHSGCVGRPVAKCREAPLLFSAVNLRSQDPRVRRCRRGACQVLRWPTATLRSSTAKKARMKKSI